MEREVIGGNMNNNGESLQEGFIDYGPNHQVINKVSFLFSPLFFKLWINLFITRFDVISTMFIYLVILWIIQNKEGVGPIGLKLNITHELINTITCVLNNPQIRREYDNVSSNRINPSMLYKHHH